MMRSRVRSLWLPLLSLCLTAACNFPPPGGADPGEPPADPCATVLCKPKDVCTVQNGQPVCGPPIVRDPCANFKCPAGQHCTAPADAPYCVADDPANDKCATVRCSKGTHCELGKCILDDPCTQIVNGSVQPLCKPEERCVVEDVVCITAPCPPIGHCEAAPACVCTKEYKPVCGSDGKTYGNACMAKCAGVKIKSEGECPTNTGPACGSSTCPAGQVCCNASCGICTPPGGACIQIACDPTK